MPEDDRRPQHGAAASQTPAAARCSLLQAGQGALSQPLSAAGAQHGSVTRLWADLGLDCPSGIASPCCFQVWCCQSPQVTPRVAPAASTSRVSDCHLLPALQWRVPQGRCLPGTLAACIHLYPMTEGIILLPCLLHDR